MRRSICMRQFCHWPESAPSSCVVVSLWVIRKFARMTSCFFCNRRAIALHLARRSRVWTKENIHFCSRGRAPDLRLKRLIADPQSEVSSAASVAAAAAASLSFYFFWAPCSLPPPSYFAGGVSPMEYISDICQTCPRVLLVAAERQFLGRNQFAGSSVILSTFWPLAPSKVNTTNESERKRLTA